MILLDPKKNATEKVSNLGQRADDEQGLAVTVCGKRRRTERGSHWGKHERRTANGEQEAKRFTKKQSKDIGNSSKSDSIILCMHLRRWVLSFVLRGTICAKMVFNNWEAPTTVVIRPLKRRTTRPRTGPNTGANFMSPICTRTSEIFSRGRLWTSGGSRVSLKPTKVKAPRQYRAPRSGVIKIVLGYPPPI